MIEAFVANLADLLPFGYAFAAGMVTTVSPCGVAMLPAYVSLYLGVDEEGFRHQPPLRRGARACLLSLAVTAGFVFFFIVAGAILSLGGEFIIPLIPWATIIIGISLILLGIWLLAGGHLYLAVFSRLADRMGKFRGSGVLGFLVFGIAYAIAAFSCTLPVFLVVVGGALAGGGFTAGLLQFVSYALGMGLVITIVTLGTAFFKEAVHRWLRRLVPLVARFSGLLLIFAGGYILYFWFAVGDLLG
ncbi:MAG: cytochrome c biogenesis protein CcdA [Dehalococcoidia bacterium]|nr:MAG: cytochrome c biogenesis protein CcdA [Dehalococcoidia bacterium]